MKKLTAKETLKKLIAALTDSLIELEECPTQTEFIYGEKTAYVECMGWVQRWRSAAKNGLNYEIEKRFPL